MAMLQDGGGSDISDLVERLEKSSSLVAQYRRRLIDAGVIGERRRGVVGFDLPYFKELIAEKLEGQRVKRPLAMGDCRSMCSLMFGHLRELLLN